MRSPDQHSRDLRSGLIGTAIAVSAWGFSGILIKSIDMGAVPIAFWRFSAYAAILAAWTRYRGDRVNLAVLRLSAPGGLCLSADVLLFFTAIKLTTVVNATTIGAMQPLIVGVFASRMFGEKVRRPEILAALVAIVAVVTIVIESAGTPKWNGWGDLAAFGTLFAWSGYFITAKRAKDLLTPMEFTFGTSVWTAGAALIAGFVFSQDMSVPNGENWLWIAAVIVVGGFLGHSMMNWSLVRVPLWLGSALTLLIPVISSIAAWIFLGESLSLIQLAAMAVVVLALAYIVIRQSGSEQSKLAIRSTVDPAGTIAP